MYKKYGETLFLTNEFKEYCSNAIRQKDIAELLLCIAYEAKDYGDSIEPNAVTSVIEDLFSNLENEVLTNGSKTSVFNFYMAFGVFNKHFVFSNKNDYLKFYQNCSEKGYTSEAILKIFDNSFSKLRLSFLNFEAAALAVDGVSIIQSSFLMKEGSESYALLESLSDPDSYPNIDSSYVYLDQINNPDFFSTASSLIFQWCVKNAKKT